MCCFGIPGSLCRGRRAFDPVVKPRSNDHPSMWAQPTKFYKTGFPLGRFAPWDLGVLAAISCPEGYRPGLVGWFKLVLPCFRGVFEQLHRAIARTCLASFAGSFFRAGCYAGKRRWRARAQRACEKATLLSCPRRSERFAANRR